MNNISTDILRLIIEQYINDPYDAIRFARCCKRFYRLTDILSKKKEIYRLLNKGCYPSNKSHGVYEGKSEHWQIVADHVNFHYSFYTEPYFGEEEPIDCFYHRCSSCSQRLVGSEQGEIFTY